MKIGRWFIHFGYPGTLKIRKAIKIPVPELADPFTPYPNGYKVYYLIFLGIWRHLSKQEYEGLRYAKRQT